MAPPVDQALVGVGQGVLEHRAGDRPVVDEAPDHAGRGARPAGRAGEHLDLQPVRRVRPFDPHEPRGGVGAGQGPDAGAAGLAGGQAEHFASVVPEQEPDLRVGRAEQTEALVDVAEFSGVGAQELAAGRHVEEQLAYLDLRARCPAVVAHVAQHAAIDLDAGAAHRAGFAGAQAEPAHAGDARQRLAAEPERRDRAQVLEPQQLAGGMPLQAQQRVVPGHARAVIDHGHGRAPAFLDAHLDVACAGVEGVVDQFADDGFGAFDHLTGRHLAGQLVRHDADLAHRGNVRFGVGGCG